jgi:hypothetical protein
MSWYYDNEPWHERWREKINRIFWCKILRRHMPSISHVCKRCGLYPVYPKGHRPHG